MLAFFQLAFIRGKLQQLVCLALCTLVVVLLCQRSPVMAQGNVNRATITEVLDSPQVFIQNKQAKVKDAANKGQKVRTGDARAQIQFNTGAVGRLAHNSVLTVGQCARLRQGQLLINGAMNGCTSSVVAGVRGTTYVLEVDEAGEASVKVLEGEVTVTKSAVPLPDESEPDAPATGNKQLSNTEPSATESNEEIVLEAGEKVSVSNTGKVGLVEKLSQEEFTALLSSGLFNGFTLELPGIRKIKDSFENLFGIPFPISVPGIRIPTPPIPIRLPF